MRGNELVNQFLLESTIPGIRMALILKDESLLLSSIIKKAHLDTMTGARFHSPEYREHSDYYIGLLKELLKNCKTDLSSSKLIKTICDNNEFNVRIGIIQKLVNMTLKYLYIICEMGYGKEFGYVIDAEKCDCPLDRTILEQLVKDIGKNKKYTPWTQLEDLDEYNRIQNDISGLEGITAKLQYDFIVWGKVLTDY